MTRIQVPTTIKEATATLVGLDDLVTAKEWTRAAIVYAFTSDVKGGPSQTRTGRISGRFSCTEFAARGIHGLRNKDTVAAYRNAWKTAITAGHADDISPGDRVDLPTTPWITGRTPETSAGSDEGTVRSARALVKRNPQAAAALASAIAEFAPEVVAETVASSESVVDAIVENRQARTKISQAHADFYEEAGDRQRQRTPGAVESGEESAAVIAGLRAVRALRDCVRGLTGIRPNARLRDELSVIVEQARPYLDFIEEAAQSRTTLTDEVEAFLASVEE